VQCGAECRVVVQLSKLSCDVFSSFSIFCVLRLFVFRTISWNRIEWSLDRAPSDSLVYSQRKKKAGRKKKLLRLERLVIKKDRCRWFGYVECDSSIMTLYWLLLLSGCDGVSSSVWRCLWCHRQNRELVYFNCVQLFNWTIEVQLTKLCEIFRFILYKD